MPEAVAAVHRAVRLALVVRAVVVPGQPVIMWEFPGQQIRAVAVVGRLVIQELVVVVDQVLWFCVTSTLLQPQ